MSSPHVSSLLMFSLNESVFFFAKKYLSQGVRVSPSYIGLRRCLRGARVCEKCEFVLLFSQQGLFSLHAIATDGCCVTLRRADAQAR